MANHNLYMSASTHNENRNGDLGIDLAPVNRVDCSGHTGYTPGQGSNK